MGLEPISPAWKADNLAFDLRPRTIKSTISSFWVDIEHLSLCKVLDYGIDES